MLMRPPVYSELLCQTVESTVTDVVRTLFAQLPDFVGAAQPVPGGVAEPIAAAAAAKEEREGPQMPWQQGGLRVSGRWCRPSVYQFLRE